MDEKQMKVWIRCVWKPFVLQKRIKYNQSKLVCILQLDHFKAHLTSGVVKNLMELNTILVEVPASCTSQAQILDVGINKPLKAYLRDARTEWILNNPSGSVSRVLVSKWIAAAWEKISPSMITNTCRRIGFFGAGVQ